MSDSKHFRNVYVVCDIFFRSDLVCFSSLPKAKIAVQDFNKEEKKYYDSLPKDLKKNYSIKKFCIKRLTVH